MSRNHVQAPRGGVRRANRSGTASVTTPCSPNVFPLKPDYLYHFSEDSSIERFVPRPVSVGPSGEALVWAVDSAHCHQFYFPRDCPRILISKANFTSSHDAAAFFSHTTASDIAAIESGWLSRMRSATIYRYTLPSDGFVLRNESAGYWVSELETLQVNVEPIHDLIEALIEAGIELRMMPSLVPLRDAVIESTVNFDIIRWRNAATD